MGYLINPIGFRVGQTFGWIDTWFFYKSHYPEFLHFVLKLRIFLNYYLDSFPTEQDMLLGEKNQSSLFSGAFLFSHYRIIFNLTSVYISLFLYSGKFWDSFYDYKLKRISLNQKFNFVSFNFFKKEFFLKNDYFLKKKFNFFNDNLVKKKLKNFLFNFFSNKTLIPLNFIFKIVDLRRCFKDKYNFSKFFLKIDDVLELFGIFFKYRIFFKYYIYSKNSLNNLKLFHNFMRKLSKKFGLNVFFLKKILPFLKLKLKISKNFIKKNILKKLVFLRFNQKFLSLFFTFVGRLFFVNDKYKSSKKKLKFFLFKRRKKKTRFLLRFSKFFWKFKRGFHLLLLFFFLFKPFGSLFHLKNIFFNDFSFSSNNLNYFGKKRNLFFFFSFNYFFFFNWGFYFFNSFFFSKNLNFYKFFFFKSLYRYSKIFNKIAFINFAMQSRDFFSIKKFDNFLLYYIKFFNNLSFFKNKINSFSPFNWFYFKNKIFFKEFYYNNYKFKFDFFGLSLRCLKFFNKSSVLKKNCFNWFYFQNRNFFFRQSSINLKFFFEKGIFYTGSFFRKRFNFFIKNLYSFSFRGFYDYFNIIRLNAIINSDNSKFSCLNYHYKNFFFDKFFYKFFFHLNFKSNGVLFFFRRLNFFLRKSRLFFFFLFNYRFINKKIEKNKQYSYFFFRMKKNIQSNFIKKTFIGDFSFLKSFFLIFLISFFNKLKTKRPSRRNLLIAQPFASLKNADWELRSFQKKFLRRFWHFKRSLPFFNSSLLKNFFFIDWDFLISFIVEKFFFKYNVDIKYFLIFILFFKDLNFFSVFSSNLSFLNTWNVLQKHFIIKILSVHFEEIQASSFDFSLQPFLLKMLPFENLRVFSYLIHNDQVTALFLAKYFAIKFSTGHSFRDIVNPVVKDLKRIAVKSLSLISSRLRINVERLNNFLTFRSFIFKKLLFKNFLLYKSLAIKLFFFFSSFFNFYLLWYFNFFFKRSADFFFLGFCKKFFLNKHIFNFFFNYDFNNFLEKIFNFFSMVLSKFYVKFNFYFSVIFEDLFSNFNLLLHGTEYFNIDLSTIKTASIFYNRVIVYSYWFYNMTWLHNVNSLNKLRARLYPMEPLKGSIFGFKFHFRGRFSRKQRAGSMIVDCGNMPLTTLSSFIDYGFVTVPLVNSIVSIKVWLFRSQWDIDVSLGLLSNYKLIRIPKKFFFDLKIKKILSNTLDDYKFIINKRLRENFFFKKSKIFLKEDSFKYSNKLKYYYAFQGNSDFFFNKFFFFTKKLFLKNFFYKKMHNFFSFNKINSLRFFSFFKLHYPKTFLFFPNGFFPVKLLNMNFFFFSRILKYKHFFKVNLKKVFFKNTFLKDVWKIFFFRNYFKNFFFFKSVWNSSRLV